MVFVTTFFLLLSAALIYRIKHQNAELRHARESARSRAVELVQVKHELTREQVRNRDLDLELDSSGLIIEDLEWQLEASAFMLAHALQELSPDHVLKFYNPAAEARKKRAAEILQEMETPEYIDPNVLKGDLISSSASSFIPEQRHSNGEARFKDSA